MIGVYKLAMHIWMDFISVRSGEDTDKFKIQHKLY